MPTHAIGPARSAISPRREMGAYEALWLNEGASFKIIADRIRNNPHALLSDFIAAEVAEQRARETLATLLRGGVKEVGVRIHGSGEYCRLTRK